MRRGTQGWRVRWLRGAATAEVWTGTRYRSKSFRPDGDGKRARDAAMRAAEIYAADEAAKVRAGVRAREQFPAATRALADAYCAELASLGRSTKHLHEVRRQLAVLADAVPNLGQRGAEVEVERLLTKPPPAAGAADGTTLSAATRNRWLVTVRALCRWAVARKRLDDDPTRLLRMAQVDDRLPPVFTLDEVRACLAHDRWDTPRPGSDPRDPYQPLFATLIYTGFRFQEAARLYWEDIDWSGGAVLVRLRAGAVVKRRKERLVPLQAELRAILEPLRRKDGPVFAGRCHNPYRGFGSFVERSGVTLGDRSPHACRHTWASVMAATGVTTDLLRAYMGHSTIITTAIYTETATRYVAGVAGWKRGELQFNRKQHKA